VGGPWPLRIQSLLRWNFETPSRIPTEQQRDEIGEAVQIDVGGVGGTVVGAEAVIYGGGEGAGVARGLHVDFGIADQNGFGGAGAEFAKNRLRAERVGFFRF